MYTETKNLSICKNLGQKFAIFHDMEQTSIGVFQHVATLYIYVTSPRSLHWPYTVNVTHLSGVCPSVCLSVPSWANRSAAALAAARRVGPACGQRLSRASRASSIHCLFCTRYLSAYAYLAWHGTGDVMLLYTKLDVRRRVSEADHQSISSRACVYGYDTLSSRLSVCTASCSSRI